MKKILTWSLALLCLGLMASCHDVPEDMVEEIHASVESVALGSMPDAPAVFVVNTNFLWSYRIEPADVDWIHIQVDPADRLGRPGTFTVSLTADNNVELGDREATVVFREETRKMYARVKVLQKGMLSTQQGILTALYHALDGPNWKKQQNWNTSEPLAKWQGVTCDENGHVTGLNLGSVGLKGELPDYIGSLTTLTSLNISANPNLTGVLPETLGDLTEITAFMAVGTGLEGTLPASMGKWSKVTNLQLNNNKITGAIPAEWAGMTEIRNFGMWGTLISSVPDVLFTSWKHIASLLLNKNPNLTGALPKAVGSITTDADKLSIWFSDCNFTGGIPEEWANLPAVSKQLRVFGNQLTEPVPLALQRHPSWTADKWNCGANNGKPVHYIRSQQHDIFLELAKPAQYAALEAIYNALDGPNWKKHAGWLESEDLSQWEGVTVDDQGVVTGLKLNGIGLKGQLPAAIGDLSGLTTVNIGTNPGLTGPLPESMGNLVKMVTFLAVNTGLEGPLPASMGLWDRVINLQLSANKITGGIPSEWAGMKELLSFGMWGTLISEIPDVIFTEWKHISSILLNKNPNLTGALPKAIGNITTDSKMLSIHLQDCNFTGGIPVEWAKIPEVSAQLRVYGNRLTEAVPIAIQKHPAWISGKWNSGAPNGKPVHYIRSQQNDVFLELATEVTAIPVTIAEVRAMAVSDDPIAKEYVMKGIVTSDVEGKNLANGNLFLQDNTGAIAVRFCALGEDGKVKSVAHTYAMGTALEINLKGCRRGNYNGLEQVTFVTEENVAAATPGANMPAPVEISINELNSGEYQGMLVTLVDVQFRDLDKKYSGSRKVENRPDAENTATVFTASYATFANEILPAGHGSITGNASAFKGAQLIIRNLNDVKLTGDRIVKEDPKPEFTSIAAVRELYTGTSVTVGEQVFIKGVVTADDAAGNLPKGMAYIQDATGGIQLSFGNSDFSGLTAGKEVELSVSGCHVSASYGVIRITGLKPENVLAVAAAAMPAPEMIGIDQFLSGAYQGRLVTIKNVQFKDNTVTYVNAASNTSHALETQEDGVWKETLLYVYGTSGFGAETVAAGKGNITGIAICYNTTQELIIRGTEDVAAMTGTRDVHQAPVVFDKISDVKDVAEYHVRGTVVGTYARGCLVSDGTGHILYYKGNDAGFAVGDILTLSGKVSLYGGFYQFPNTATVTKIGRDEGFTQPNPEVLTGPDMDAWIAAPVIKYVSYTGKLKKNKNFYNVSVENATTAIGSLQYPIDALHAADYDGKTIKVTGYTVAVSQGKYVNTMVLSIELAE